MKYEDQLERISSKATLHKLIDSLEDTDQIFFLIERYKAPGSFHTLGDITLERILWMMEKFKHFWLLNPNNGS